MKDAEQINNGGEACCLLQQAARGNLRGTQDEQYGKEDVAAQRERRSYAGGI